MHLKNWYKSAAATYFGKYADYIKHDGSHTGNVGLGLCMTNHGLKYVSNAYKGGSGGVIFGDGDTEPIVDDYKLSGNLISGLSASVVQTQTVEDDYMEIENVYTLTNTNTTEVTIREVAYCHQLSAYGVLMERTVLDEPVTIPAGGVGQVTYTIRMNYPTA